MKCPNCNAAMVVVEIDSVELDYCPECRGIWLDGGELDLLLEAASNRDALMASLKSRVGGKSPRIRCPICSRKLRMVTYGDTVLLDMCPKGDGLWLDDGEIRDVLKMGEFPEDHNIYELLNDIFGQESKT